MKGDIVLERGERLIKMGRATSGFFDASGMLYLTCRRVHWKRGRFQVLFGSHAELDIPLRDIRDCKVSGLLGFSALNLIVREAPSIINTVYIGPPDWLHVGHDITDSRMYSFTVKGNSRSPLVMFHRRTAEEWRQAILDAMFEGATVTGDG